MEKKIFAFALVALLLFSIPIFAAPALPEKANGKALGNYFNSRQNYDSAKKSFDKNPDLGNAKTLLLNSIDRVLSYSDVTLESISSSAVLSSEAKSSLSSLINEKSSSLEGLRSKIDSSTTKEELRLLLRESKIKIADFLPLLKKLNSLNSLSRQENALEKLSVGADRLEARISSLESKGADVSAAKDLLSRLRASISSAKTYSDAAKADLSSTTASNIDEKLSSAEAQFRACKAEMQNSVSLMKQVISALRKGGNSFEGASQKPPLNRANQFQK